MNWQWTDAEDSKTPFECNVCHRTVYVLGQYLPDHRKKGERKKCKGSGSHRSFHKQLNERRRTDGRP